MCVHNFNLMEHEAVQLVKDFTTQQACRAVKLYLNKNEECCYSKLIEHLSTQFESGETVSSLLCQFLLATSYPKETEDKFTNELQTLARKVISICPEWKSQMDMALKTQFVHRLWNQYFAAMANILFKQYHRT